MAHKKLSYFKQLKVANFVSIPKASNVTAKTETVGGNKIANTITSIREFH